MAVKPLRPMQEMTPEERREFFGAVFAKAADAQREQDLQDRPKSDLQPLHQLHPQDARGSNQQRSCEHGDGATTGTRMASIGWKPPPSAPSCTVTAAT